MDIVEQIKEICVETDNEWFLTHDFTKIALSDLQLKEKLEKEENILTLDGHECTCHTNIDTECIGCIVQLDREEEIKKLNVHNVKGRFYDFDRDMYINSKWIIPDRIEGKIPGFILLKCTGDDVNGSLFTHGLEFACVRPEYRKQGILKNMVYQIPKEWNIWLEANSNEIKNVENIWEKCGFQYHCTISSHGWGEDHKIYKKISVF